MPQEQSNPAVHASKVPNIPEILTQILLLLGHTSITRAAGVCHYWSKCVKSSPPLQRKILKLPCQAQSDPNPNFHDLTEESKNAVIPRSTFKGQNLWKTIRGLEDDFLAGIHDMTAEEAKERDDLIGTLDYWDNSYEGKLNALHNGFRGVRHGGSGWPVGLRELHCDLCGKWHTDFRFETLHPLFGFLEDMTMCFRGYGSRLILNFSFVSYDTVPMSCWVDSCKEIVEFGKYLKKACNAIAVGGEGVAQDFWSSTAVTKLVMESRGDDCGVAENNEGLKLEDVLPFIIRLFREQLRSWRLQSHVKLPIHRSLHRVATDRHIYPTENDWRAHVEQYGRITKMWEMAMAEVDEIMSDSSLWKSILEEKLDIGEYSYNI